jgi:hypothetical protein
LEAELKLEKKKFEDLLKQQGNSAR